MSTPTPTPPQKWRKLPLINAKGPCANCGKTHAPAPQTHKDIAYEFHARLYGLHMNPTKCETKEVAVQADNQTVVLRCPAMN